MRAAALVLAAGAGRRFGAGKLVAPLGGRAMVAHVAKAAQASRADPVIVVLGHGADAVRAAVGGGVLFVHAADHAEGIAASLRSGLSAVPDASDGVLVCLGDMPLVSAAVMDRIIGAARRDVATVPVHGGRRGNPVLWGRRFFPVLAALRGDVGARTALTRYPTVVREVAVGSDDVLLDADTPADLAMLAARLGIV